MSNPTKRYDICAGRPYTTRDGEEKKHWIQVGRLTEWSDGGPSIELHAVPTGSWFDGKLSCFEQKDDKAGNGARPACSQAQPAARPQRSAPPPQDDDPDDDFPR